MNLDYDNRPEKARERDRLLNKLHRTNFINPTILLPGPTCTDLLQLKDRGMIDRRYTELILVEKDPRCMEQIKTTCTYHGLENVQFHLGELKDCRPAVSRIGFAFVDLNGLPDAGLFDWFAWLTKKLTVGSVVGFTWSARVPKKCFPRKLLESSYLQHRTRHSKVLSSVPIPARGSAIVLDTLALGSGTDPYINCYRERKTKCGQSASAMYTGHVQIESEASTLVGRHIRSNIFKVLSRVGNEGLDD